MKMIKKLMITAIFAAMAVNLSALELTVSSVKGKAETMEGSAWVKLEQGKILNEGSVIQTGYKSEVVLTAGGTTLTVAPLSRISVSQLTEKKIDEKTTREVSSFKLESGSVRSTARHTDTRKVGHTITGAVATASVRGTDFEVKNGYRSTAIKTYEGRVAAWPSKDITKASEEEIAEEETPVEAAESGAGETGESVETAEAVETAGTETTETAMANDTGTAAQDVSDFAPRGAGTVTAGQASSFASDGSVKTAQSSAREKSKKLNAVAATAVEQSAGISEEVAVTATSSAARPATANVTLEW